MFKQILAIDGWGISHEIALIWMSLDFTDDQSTLVQVMAWCHQATSHYLSQCWPRSLWPYGVTRRQLSLITATHLKIGHPYISSMDALSWKWVAVTSYGNMMSYGVMVLGRHCFSDGLLPQMAPSHYLNRCWLIISKVQWLSSEGNFTRDILTISY